ARRPRPPPPPPRAARPRSGRARRGALNGGEVGNRCDSAKLDELFGHPTSPRSRGERSPDEVRRVRGLPLHNPASGTHLPGGPRSGRIKAHLLGEPPDEPLHLRRGSRCLGFGGRPSLRTRPPPPPTPRLADLPP